jgi:uncharacterized protein YjbI with pentapeptide repeats
VPDLDRKTGEGNAMFAIGNASLLGRASALAAFIALAPQTVTAAPDCRSSPYPGVNWQECNKKLLMLKGSDLSGANLVEVDFSFTDLRNTNLLASNLEKAKLVRASLSGAKAKGTKFDRIEAYRTDFSQIDAEGATFASAEMQRSAFVVANLVNVNFAKAELGRAEFDGATISGSNFELANLARANLRTAKFTGPLNFKSAFLFLTRLEGVDLSEAKGLAQWQLEMACGDSATKLPAGLAAGASWPCKFDDD